MPRQVIGEPAEVPLPVVDPPSGPHREQAARKLAAQLTAAPFDLAHGPLLRAELFRLSGREHVLVLAAHHIVCDEWSMGILRQELTTLYGAFSGGGPAPLAPLEVQYADYAAWQRNWLTGEPRERLLAYWRGQLAALPAL